MSDEGVPTPPDWLSARFRDHADELHALGRTGPRPAVRRGAIAYAVAAEATAELVVVTHAGPDVLEVHFVSEDVGGATDADIIVDPEQTGMAIPCVLAADLVTSVFVHQLGPTLGTVASQTLDRLERIARGLDDGDGPPLLDRLDGRHATKLDDLRRIQGIGADCVGTLLAAADAPFGVLLDEFAMAAAAPEAVRVDHTDPGQRRFRLSGEGHETVIVVVGRFGGIEIGFHSGDELEVLPDRARLASTTGPAFVAVASGMPLHLALRAHLRWPSEGDS